MKRALFSLALFGLLACSSKQGDPPPPVGSGTLPIAPPGATGALAAGREETAARPGLTPPEDSMLDDEDEDPGTPVVPSPSPPDDGGTAL